MTAKKQCEARITVGIASYRPGVPVGRARADFQCVFSKGHKSKEHLSKNVGGQIFWWVDGQPPNVVMETCCGEPTLG